MVIRNLFKEINLPTGNEEIFESLCKAKNVHIERIVSKGQITPPGNWYEPKKYEWVVLLQGKATLELEGGEDIHLAKGDHLLIPAGQKHRVSYTSTEPYCIWLAVHFD